MRALLLERAGRDPRVVAAAVTGSGAVAGEDGRSDIDLAFGIADGAERSEVVRDWTRLLEHELEAVHHWDLPAGDSLFRVFLLPNGLEVDVSFTPAAAFGSYGARFRLVFGSARELPGSGEVDTRRLVGLSWHHALHARTALERGKPWQALHLVSNLRDHVLELACASLSLPATAGKGFDAVPAALRERLAAALPGSLEPAELQRTLTVCVEALLDELGSRDPALAAALAGPLLAAALAGPLRVAATS